MLTESPQALLVLRICIWLYEWHVSRFSIRHFDGATLSLLLTNLLLLGCWLAISGPVLVVAWPWLIPFTAQMMSLLMAVVVWSVITRLLLTVPLGGRIDGLALVGLIIDREIVSSVLGRNHGSVPCHIIDALILLVFRFGTSLSTRRFNEVQILKEHVLILFKQPIRHLCSDIKGCIFMVRNQMPTCMLLLVHSPILRGPFIHLSIGILLLFGVSTLCFLFLQLAFMVLPELLDLL